MKKHPIVYVVNTSFLPSSYMPGTDEECKKYFLQTLDTLVASVCKFRETNISIPKFLVLKDPIANNIFWEYQYSFENELLAKLTAYGLSDINVFHCLVTQSSISVVEKIHKEFPGYYLNELKENINSLLPYMEPDDGQESYLIYKLSKNQAENAAALKEIIDNGEEQSPLWDEYFDLLKRSNGQRIEGLSHYLKLPKNYEGRKYSVIFTSGEMLEAEVVFFGNIYAKPGELIGFYWKISETDFRIIDGVAAWKKINQA
ncbi:MAG: hypothetical protein WCT50_02515 [Patescibacteria group bacterium]